MSVKGNCLCKAVRIAVEAELHEISACHCDMCRQWSGSIQMGIEVPQDAVTITGPVKTYRSSGFAERAWCGNCGSALWLRNVEGPDTGVYELVPGLFANAGGARLVREVYADRCPDGYALAGQHTWVTRDEYESRYAHVASAPIQGA